VIKLVLKNSTAERWEPRGIMWCNACYAFAQRTCVEVITKALSKHRRRHPKTWGNSGRFTWLREINSMQILMVNLC